MMSHHVITLPPRYFSLYFCLLSLCYIHCSNSLEANEKKSLSASLTQVWGPGLNPSLVLPFRYFFIQAVDTTGRKLNVSAGENAIQLRMEGISRHCPIFKELLDRKDGTYIARYRLFGTCEGLRIIIRLQNGKHVGSSPYEYRYKTIHSDCTCPVLMDQWQQAAACPETFPQINRDLAEFSPKGIPYNITAYFEEMSLRYHRLSASFCHYILKQQKLYRKCFGEHVGFNMFMDQILLFLMRRALFADVQFIVNLGDYPLAKKGVDTHDKWPIFSWCGSTDTYDIVMPTYDITESSLMGMDRVVLDMLSVQATLTPTWKDKVPKAFWRGRDARRERLSLVDIARNNSDLIDAALTNFFFFRDEEALYGPKVPYTEFFQFFKHKIQINLDGTVAAYRFPYLLAGDSVVLKQDSTYYEHFYNDIQPWKHYIPLERDLGDLVEKIKWALLHDEESAVISKNGASFARDSLLPHNVFCYYTILLERWSKMVSVPDVVPQDFELVSQPAEPSDCDCQSSPELTVKQEL